MTGLSFVKSESKSRSERPCGCSVSGIRRNRSTTLTKRIFRSGKCCFRIATAASASIVGMSPAQAITTSGSAPSSVRRPLPDADTLGAMNDRLIHVEIMQVRLLVRDDDVDIVARTQAVIRHAQQAIRVGRQVDAYDIRTLVA